jgi:transposase InsO family protein
MPWQPRGLMDVKREFVQLARQAGANRRELCRRFGIGPKAAYALLARYEQEGDAAFVERSRRPHGSPGKTPAAMECALVALRKAHPAWGGRKLARRLSEIGYTDVPSPSTVTAILRRHGLISVEASEAAQHWQRFEHEAPNSLWQIDFKGYFETGAGRCHPMTLLDDHSRFNLALHACRRPDTAHVRAQLVSVFERYGLPQRINADNGSPWGTPSRAENGLSALSVWLIRQGISVSHSTPYHPQTNGKLERFHRSLKAEVLNGRTFRDLDQVQTAFERWRGVYNHERPHEALALQTPMQRYRPSPKSYASQLPPIEYAPDDIVLKVPDKGWLKFRGLTIRMSEALYRLPVALRPVADGCFDIYFCHQRFMRLDMNALTASN